jgi:hypothetical protein
MIMKILEKKSVLLNDDLHHEFKKVCVEHNLVMNKTIERLMKNFLKEKGVNTDTLRK